jgi:hypothetical protein
MTSATKTGATKTGATKTGMNTTMKTTSMSMILSRAAAVAARGRRLLAAASLLALLALPACGEVSYFEVTVTGPLPTGNWDPSMVTSCEVLVTKASSEVDHFNMLNCNELGFPPSATQLGTFQWGTESTGDFTFTVDMFDGSRVKRGSGSGTAPVLKGARQTLTVTISPS